MNKKPKILILGGTGFLGKSINDCEKIKKNFEITNINSKELDLRENELVDNEKLLSYSWSYTRV